MPKPNPPHHIPLADQDVFEAEKKAPESLEDERERSKPMCSPTLRVLVCIVALALLSLCLVGTLVCFTRVGTPTFGVVDSQRLISWSARALAIQYPQGSVPQVKLRETIESLKADIKTWSCTHKVILIAKGAVWGGDLPDYTDTFMAGEP